MSSAPKRKLTTQTSQRPPVSATRRPTRQVPQRVLDAAARTWFSRQLPELQRRIGLFVRRFPSQAREDAGADILAEAFRYCISAARRGKLDRLTPASLIRFFGRHVASGRTACSHPATDVLSRMAQRRRGFQVHSFESRDPNPKNTQRIRFADALADRRSARPLENVRRNLDYDEILDRQKVSASGRRVFEFLAETAGAGRQRDLAAELGVSAPRVTQTKRKLAAALAAEGYGPRGWRPRHSAQAERVRGERNSTRLQEIPLNVGSTPAPRRA